jgi:hypothetical protein
MKTDKKRSIIRNAQRAIKSNSKKKNATTVQTNHRGGVWYLVVRLHHSFKGCHTICKCYSCSLFTVVMASSTCSNCGIECRGPNDLIELRPCKHSPLPSYAFGVFTRIVHPRSCCVQHVASSVFEGEEVTHPSPDKDIRYNPDAHLDPVWHWIVEGAQDNTGIVYSIFQ